MNERVETSRTEPRSREWSGAELADWITAWAPNLTPPQRKLLAALGINSILGARFATSLFHQPQTRIPDDQYLNEWTAVLTARMRSLLGSNGT